MKVLAHYALTIGAAAALLAGCGESQPVGTTQDAMHSIDARAAGKASTGLTWVEQKGSIKEGSYATVRAVCPYPDADVVTGGGFKINVPAGTTWSLTASQPYQSLGKSGPEDAWSVTGFLSGDTLKVQLTVYAGCMPRVASSPL